jgi:hypothetical protein
MLEMMVRLILSRDSPHIRARVPERTCPPAVLCYARRAWDAYKTQNHEWTPTVRLILRFTLFLPRLLSSTLFTSFYLLPLFTPNKHGPHIDPPRRRSGHRLRLRRPSQRP